MELILKATNRETERTITNIISRPYTRSIKVQIEPIRRTRRTRPVVPDRALIVV